MDHCGHQRTTIVSRKDIRGELGDLRILNPDALAQKLAQDRQGMTEDEANLLPVTETEAEVARCIEAGESVLIETVLSTLKYEKHVLRPRELGRYVGMIYVALRTADQAIERVHNRKKLGGHDVPEAKIRARWKRSLDNVARFTPLLDRLLVFSNASDEGNAVLIARKRRGVFEILDPDSLPEITQRLSPFLAKS